MKSTRKLLILKCVHMNLEAPHHHHVATLLSKKPPLIMRRYLGRWQQQHFYVDDLLKSVLNADESYQLIETVINMCAKGVFNLTKFTSNKKEVLVNITDRKRRKMVKVLKMRN